MPIIQDSNARFQKVIQPPINLTNLGFNALNRAPINPPGPVAEPLSDLNRTPIPTEQMTDLKTVIPQGGVPNEQIEAMSADKLESGEIAAQFITLKLKEGNDQDDCAIAAGKTDFDNTETGLILGYDASTNTVKFLMGSSTDYINMIAGNIIITGALSGRVVNTGDGSDGALAISSGTTNLSLNTIYNYTTIDVTGTATLSTTDTNGILFLRCLGDFNLASGATIDLSGAGGPGGAGKSSDSEGDTGTNGYGTIQFDATATRHGGEGGSSTGSPPNANGGGGGGGAGAEVGSADSSASADGGLELTEQSTLLSELSFALYKHLYHASGSGGGGGGYNNGGGGSASGAGGAGGGALVCFVGGDLNIAGTINCNGDNGSNSSGTPTGGGIGGGGGGGGGMILFVVAGTITDSATKTVAGGSGGTGDEGINGTGFDGGAGGAGKSLILNAI